MRIVFWQNCLSPHQLPYIVHLMDDKRVGEVVVVQKKVSVMNVKKWGGNWGVSPKQKNAQL